MTITVSVQCLCQPELEFDVLKHSALTLSTPNLIFSSEEGYLYDKEAIIEYVLKQKQDYEKQMKEYHRQCRLQQVCIFILFFSGRGGGSLCLEHPAGRIRAYVNIIIIISIRR